MQIQYRLPDNLDQEINELEGLIAKCKQGEMSPAELKLHRVPFGVYEQRKSDTYMVRVRCAAGCITPEQLIKIAELATRYGSDKIHLTTRQEIQIHYVTLDNLIPVMRGLKETGLASRGGGGNTVRNIMSQEDAGISLDEAFDTTPYALALTSRLIAESDSWTLPRKFKIAFSGSSEDRGYATIADVGFITRIKDGQKGFKVYVAGGLGAKSDAGHFLLDFIEDDQVYAVTTAVKRIFWKYGNRKNKHAARLRFLWNTLGPEEFQKRFDEEYQAVKTQNLPPLTIEAIDNSGRSPVLREGKIEDQNDFELWEKRFVQPQKQKGIFSIIVPVHLGYLDNAQAVRLGQFLRPFGENVLRMSKDQNFLIRNIPETYLGNVYLFLKDTLDHFNRPLFIDKMISCAGASTCQLGICLSRPAANAVIKALSRYEIPAKALDTLSDIRINISGCPNACGQHPIAHLGFFGKVARKGDKVYPAYNVVAGAVVRDGETKLNEKLGEISARDIPAFIQEALKRYLSKSSEHKNFEAYLEREGKEDLRKLCAQYKEIPSFEEDKNTYFDWDSDKLFSVADRGKGECSAGLFDLIDMDLKMIEETRKKLDAGEAPEKKPEHLRTIVYYAARALLITRGCEPKTEKELHENFTTHFIHTGLVAGRFQPLLEMARERNDASLCARAQDVLALADRVKLLYEIMDNAFQFKINECAALPTAGVPQHPGAFPSREITTSPPSLPKIVKDFRGVTCPMNFVKTKMALAKLQPRELLEIWLDDGQPIENVPGSVREEGHAILEQKKINDYWAVVIEKK
ncbi:MAG TPA: sulfite reductase subunit beta (hemoprotein) [Candidatus Omnitrophica bacterium]|nr:MAG: hypothetical protein A2Z81_06780 [Omnitrophica WOR_2 bacterium GWA2_45_18]HBR15076.1 sulfite reductase subunit beta (hemoprotein) [Candidatus Omnitrophota bacterium]